MSDSNMHFDPYTGDPIPDDTNTAENNTNQTYSNPDTAPVQDENSASNHSYSAPEQPQYYNEYQLPPEQPQYNPYTGQPVNNASGASSTEDAEKDRKANIYGTVSLITGIAAIIFSFCSTCCCPFISLVAGVVGIIFGCIAKNSMGIRKGTAVAGIITSIIGLVLMVILTIVEFAYMLGSDDCWNEFQKEFRKSMNEYNNYNDDYDYDDDSFHYNFNSYKNFDNDTYNSDNFYAK